MNKILLIVLFALTACSKEEMKPTNCKVIEGIIGNQGFITFTFTDGTSKLVNSNTFYKLKDTYCYE